MDALWRARIRDYHHHSLYRKRHVLPPRTDLRVFCSNDYLGLAQHPAILEALQQGATQYGVGGASSQMVVGHRSIHHQVECAFARFLNRDAALLFSCGYMANIGVISAIARKGDALLMDKYVHASLLDGARVSDAQLLRYPHKNYAYLEKQLALDTVSANNRFIVTDSVFSMQGDIADLASCADLAERYKAVLVVDDAHGIGILGAGGRGAAEYFHLDQTRLPILICPLAKAFGVMGAIVAGSQDLIDYLVQCARAYMYTTAIPPGLAAAALKSLDIIETESWRRERLIMRIQYFKKRAAEYDLPLLESHTPIQCLVIGDAALAQAVSDGLYQRGIILNAMRPPSVPANQSCLRITLSCMQEEPEIDMLLDNVREVYGHLL